MLFTSPAWPAPMNTPRVRLRRQRGLLRKAEEDHKKDRGRRAVISVAREAAQAAEDSRLIALQRREAELRRARPTIDARARSVGTRRRGRGQPASRTTR